MRKLLRATLIVKREASITGEPWVAFTAARATSKLAEIAISHMQSGRPLSAHVDAFTPWQVTLSGQGGFRIEPDRLTEVGDGAVMVARGAISGSPVAVESRQIAAFPFPRIDAPGAVEYLF